MQQIREHKQGHMFPFCYSFLQTAGVAHAICAISAHTSSQGVEKASVWIQSVSVQEGGEVRGDVCSKFRVHGEAGRQGTLPPVPVQQCIIPWIKLTLVL